MSVFKRKAILTIGLTIPLLMIVPTVARADITIVIYQQGSNVEADASGSVNLAGLSLVASSESSILPGIDPASAALDFGPSTSTQVLVDVYSGLQGPSTIGPGSRTDATTASGTVFGIGSGAFAVPAGATTGHDVSATDVWDNTTLSMLGLTVGTYDFGTSSDAAEVVVIVRTPEPTTLPLALSGLVLLVLLKTSTEKQRRNNVQPCIKSRSLRPWC